LSGSITVMAGQRFVHRFTVEHRAIVAFEEQGRAVLPDQFFRWRAI
jgi:hypothetical protein